MINESEFKESMNSSKLAIFWSFYLEASSRLIAYIINYQFGIIFVNFPGLWDYSQNAKQLMAALYGVVIYETVGFIVKRIHKDFFQRGRSTMSVSDFTYRFRNEIYITNSFYVYCIQGVALLILMLFNVNFVYGTAMVPIIIVGIILAFLNILGLALLITAAIRPQINYVRTLYVIGFILILPSLLFIIRYLPAVIKNLIGID